MASTKTNTVIKTSASVTAGATVNSTMFTATTDYGSICVVQITNGATAPTTSTIANLQFSPDAGTTYVTVRTFTAGLTNSGVYGYTWAIDAGVRYYRVQFIGGATTATTCYAFVDSLTTI